jgi:hypothetical protein
MKRLNVLIACEESQRVCMAFREKGHRAFSADIQECSGGHPEWHILGDVLPILNGNCEFTLQNGERERQDGKWDLIIAHPPCTYLSNVATRQYSLKCNTAEKVVNRWEERARAAVFFMHFALADCEKICVENPVGFMNSSFRKADQIIHPYYFAESVDDTENYHEKRTCLWLKGLSPLKSLNQLPKPEPMYICNGEKSKGKKIGWCEGMRNIKGGQAERAKARSKTFPGIAKAMAEQWG